MIKQHRYFLLTFLSILAAMVFCQKSTAAPNDFNSADIFSTPDTNVAPTFAGRIQANSSGGSLVGATADPPDRDALLAIPSITGQQRGQINSLFQQERDANRPLQGEIESLRRILNERKSTKLPSLISQGSMPPLAPPAMQGMMIGDSDFGGAPTTFANDSEDSMKARIDALRDQIKDNDYRLWQNCQSLLSPDQLNQLQEMRLGQLLISSNASTNVPEPVTPPKPMPGARPMQMSPYPPGFRPAPYAPIVRPYGYPQQHPLLNTTKQLLYQTLWRL